MKDRTRFIIRNGVLRVGLPTGVAGAVIFHALSRGSNPSSYLSLIFLVELLSFILWSTLVLGVGWGWVMWKKGFRDHEGGVQ